MSLALGGCHPATPPAAPGGAEIYTNDGPLPGATQIVAVLPRGGPSETFSWPWPTELLRRDGGSPDLASFPGRQALVISGYADFAERELDGFSLASTIYFRFTGAPRTAMPAPAISVDPRSPLLLVDVDPESPERGTRIPLEARLYATETRYVPAGTLAVKPLAGFVLRPGNLYAAVVRREFGDASGAPLGTSRDLEIVKTTARRSDPVEERARALHRPALDALSSMGVRRADIAGLAVFRTQHATSQASRLVATVDRLSPPFLPRIVRAAWDDGSSLPGPSGYDTVRGYYCTPNFQSSVEEAPFLRKGGALSVDASGAPVPSPIVPGSRVFADDCAPMLRARFVLTVPRTPAPPGGHPLFIVGHGTGGSADSFLGAADFAGWAARAGVAALSTDQPLHGRIGDAGVRPGKGAEISLSIGPFRVPLNGVDAEMLFYNPLRPEASRGNMLQAAADVSVLVRLFGGVDLSQGTPERAGLLPRATTPRLSSDRVMIGGHSQGSQSAAIVGALDPRVRGALLSGCGGDARYGILFNREAARLRGVIEPLLGLAPDELDPFHPLLALAQMLSDGVDPQSFAALYRLPAPPRTTPQNVLHFVGVGDSYNPLVAGEALAVALRATPLFPLPQRPIALSLLGIEPLPVVAGNVGGRATAVWAELVPTRREDGHFVIYSEPGADELVVQFLRGIAAGDAPPAVGPKRLRSLQRTGLAASIAPDDGLARRIRSVSEASCCNRPGI
jgi:hypothetical protein